MIRRTVAGVAALIALAALGLAVITAVQLESPAPRLAAFAQAPVRAQVLDRTGVPLSRSYGQRWNLEDRRPLHELPPRLVRTFVVAEDARFDRHSGVDWQARGAALWQNLSAGRTVRGASTITEQVVRLLNPRPRTLWSRWLEGWEAMLLERSVSKRALLEFYLNQVPFSSRRRGVVQAARYYFGRDVDTLSGQQMQALAVLVRAPSRFDPRRGDAEALMARVNQLRGRLGEPATRQPLELAKAPDLPDAAHYVRMLRQRFPEAATHRGTLDASLQRRLQGLLDQRLNALADRDVGNGAMIVVAHQPGEVRAWLSRGALSPHVDAVTTPRQPGSTLKPFLYALALERGWREDDLIEDAPLGTPVGHGLHVFSNYSRSHNGAVRLREALASSLNLPAVRLAREVGAPALLERLRAFGFDELIHDAAHYGEGLALGNGEVTLEHLTAAYAALARGGAYQPLLVRHDGLRAAPRRVLSLEAAHRITAMLADPSARELAFGRDSVLQLPRPDRGKDRNVF